MSKFSPLLLLAIAALCFYSGYTVGIKKGRIMRPPAAAATPAEVPPPAATAAAEPTPITVETAAPAAQPTDASTETMLLEHEHALRAAQTPYTFTDQTGRQLVADVMEAHADNLKIRRQSDGYVLTLPVTMLSEKDQAFAAYLAQKSNPQSKAETRSMEEMIWDELFN